LRWREVVTLVALAITQPVWAKAPSCRVPERLSTPRVETPPADEPRRAPAITSYLLAMSWSPEHCARNRRETQCDGSAGRFGFVLHGLWPEAAGTGYPQWCAAGGRLQPTTLRRNFCMTPSEQLLQHEWQKHGTCMTSDPDRYFAAARRAYARVQFPAMASLARRNDITAGEFRRRFARANRGISADMLVVLTRDSGGDESWLHEVRLCLSKALKPQRCPAFIRGAPDRQKMKIRTVP